MISEVVSGLISIIQENIIAKTNTVSNVYIGDTVINVENSFHFEDGQEIVLIDYGYNDPTSPHYQAYEYAQIKEVNNTNSVTLTSAVQSDWLLSKNSFIQKTIGHSPLYEDRVYYGDRAVIPTEEMAVTIEPTGLSNEWIYIMGGLSNEYRMDIYIYAKNVETEDGMIILNKYTDAIMNLLNSNLHIDINNYETPLLANVAAGSVTVIVADTADNRENFVVSAHIGDDMIYEVQDNNNIEIDLYIDSVLTPGDGKMYITMYRKDSYYYGNMPFRFSYKLSDYALLRKHGRYFYDSRVDGVDCGTVQKGSSILRVAKLSWFGKEIQEYHFPQKSKANEYFPEVSP